jgi:hypothetical protein
MDLSSLEAAIDYSEAGAAIVLVAGAVAAVYVLIKGVRLALSMIGGGDSERDAEGSDSDSDYWDGYTDEDDARDRRNGGLD